MFLVTIIAFILFLFTLFRTKSVLKASLIYGMLLIIYLLLYYRVLFSSLLTVNYTKYLYLPLLLVLINVIYWAFNRIIRSEIGYNFTNLLVTLFPINEMRYVTLFLVSLVQLTPYYIINVLLLFLVSCLLNLSRLFSMFIIFVATLLSTYIHYLPLTDNSTLFNIFIIGLLFVVALGFILLIISTNYKQEYNLSSIVKDNYQILLASSSIFIVMLIFLSHQFRLITVMNVSVFATLSCIMIMSNTKKHEAKENVEDINNKYPYLLSIMMVIINIIVLTLGSYVTSINQTLLIVIQIIVLIVFNGGMFMFLDLPELEENYELPKRLGLKNNGIIALAMVMGLVLELLVVQSSINIGNFNTSITQTIVDTLNHSPRSIALFINTILVNPFVVNYMELAKLGLDPMIVSNVVMIGSLLITISPISFLIVSAMVNIKPKRLIEAYQFCLIFLLIVLVIIELIIIQ